MFESSPISYPFSDVALSRRLERTEAISNARFVEARARLFPESGAEWIEVAGAYAMFDTPSSPLTQTFGLGIFESVTNLALDRIERFFQERGAPVFHEVSPLADSSLPAMLHERGYEPFEFTSVLYRPIHKELAWEARRNENIHVRLVREDEYELCARISAQGWSEHPEIMQFLLEIGEINTQRAGALSFFAELGGRPVATGVLCLGEGVALLGGASTIPEARKQGAQLALLESRLRYAVDQGCDLAMMCAQPGSASQRNAERHGFHIAYTRIKWRLPQHAAKQ